MTVETQTTKVNATGNGVATTFSFSPLVIYDSTQIEVTKVTLADGAEELLTEGTGSNNYSVSPTGDYPSTGSIVYPADTVTPMTSDYKLTMRRVLPLTQLTDLNNQGGYFADVQENQFDKLVMQNLQQQEELDRSLKVPVGYSGAASFEVPVPDALKLIRWDATALALESVSLATLGAVTSYASAPEDVSLTAAAVGSSTDYAPGNHVHLLPTVSVAKGGTGATDAGTALTNLGLSANGKSLVTAADYAAMKTLLSLVVGTNVQAYDALLASIAALGSQAAGDLLYLSAADTIARLGIGSTDEVLTVAGGVPTWAAGAGGAWAEIASGSISGAGPFDFAFTAASWRAVKLVLTNVDLSGTTTNGALTMNLTRDNFTGVVDGANTYRGHRVDGLSSTSTPTDTNLDTTTAALHTGNLVADANDVESALEITIWGPNATGWVAVTWEGTVYNGTNIADNVTGGVMVRDDGEAAGVNGIRISLSAGSIGSGNYKVLGLTE